MDLDMQKLAAQTTSSIRRQLFLVGFVGLFAVALLIHHLMISDSLADVQRQNSKGLKTNNGFLEDGKLHSMVGAATAEKDFGSLSKLSWAAMDAIDHFKTATVLYTTGTKLVS